MSSEEPKPTIAELEDASENAYSLEIKPDGSVTTKSKDDRIAELEQENERLRGIGMQVVDDREKMEEERVRLQSIVDRLPKTADGVPVVPGMALHDRSGLVGVVKYVGSDTALVDIDGELRTWTCQYYYAVEQAKETGDA